MGLVKPTQRFNRRNILRLMVAGAAGSVANGFWIEPDSLSITRQDVSCKKLPPGLDGLRIGLIADLHYRPVEDAGLLEKVVARIQQEKPDIIALAGDYISADPGVITPMLECLGNMNATQGIFAVMGSHDGWAGNAAVIRRQFEKAGITFLINQHSLLSIRGESLAVAGTDFVWLGRPDPVKTMRGIPKNTPILALVHEPDYFDTMCAARSNLTTLRPHSRRPMSGSAIGRGAENREARQKICLWKFLQRRLPIVRHPRRWHERSTGEIYLSAGAGNPHVAGIVMTNRSRDVS